MRWVFGIVICVAFSLIFIWSLLGYQNSASSIRHVLMIFPEKYSQTLGSGTSSETCVHIVKPDWQHPPDSELKVSKRHAQECFTADVVLKYSYFDYLFFGYSALLVTTEPSFDLQETLNSPPSKLLDEGGFPGSIGSFFIGRWTRIGLTPSSIGTTKV